MSDFWKSVGKGISGVAGGMVSPILDIVGSVVGGVTDHYKAKRELKAAVSRNNIRMAESSQTHNQNWEILQLKNAGYKDDVLFYAWIMFFVYSGFYPEGAAEVVKNWEVLPDWFLKISFVLVGTVTGVKKLGDYIPVIIRGVKTALTEKGDGI